MEAHPLANAFPLMEGQEFDDLVADIDKNGLHHPVVRFEGKILDGRNRYNACQTLGIPHRETEYHGDDPVGFVISENITRRHLDPAQRAMAAEKLATASLGYNQHSNGEGPSGEVGTDGKATTTAEAAELMGVSHASVERVRQTRRRAVPEVVDAMEKGDLSPNAAAKLARLPAERQTEIMTTTDPKDVATVANSITGTTGEATVIPLDKAAREAKKGPGRGSVGPKVLMARHMDLPDTTMIVKLSADWEEHKELIGELDADRVKTFLADLKRARTATTRLINLIEHGDVRGTLAKAAAVKASSDVAHGGAPKSTSPRAKAAATKRAAKPKATATGKNPSGVAKAPAKRAAKAPAKAVKAEVPAADTSAPTTTE